MPFWGGNRGIQRARGARGKEADALGAVDDRLQVLEHKERGFAARAAQYRAEAAVKAREPRGKRHALNLLRQAAVYDDSAQSLQMQRLNLEQQRLALDLSATNAETIQAQQTMAVATAAAHAAANPDAVHDLVDTMEEQQELMREVGDALAAPSVSSGHDADDFEDELAALLGEAAVAAEAAPAAVATPAAAAPVPYLGPGTQHLADPTLPAPAPAAPAAALVEDDALLSAFG